MSEGVVTIPESACCWGCGYSLRGLGENRCPECGRGFEPGDAESYRLAKGAPAWAIRIASPPPKWMLWLYAGWSLAMMASDSAPRAIFEINIPLLVIGLAVIATWCVHYVCASIVLAWYVFPRSFGALPHARWGAMPIIVVLTIVLMGLRVPLRLRFLLSLPWLSASLYDGYFPNFADGWIGLFPGMRMQGDSSGVSFRFNCMDNYGSGYWCGFAYSVGSRPNGNDVGEAWWLIGNWYVLE